MVCYGLFLACQGILVSPPDLRAKTWLPESAFISPWSPILLQPISVFVKTVPSYLFKYCFSAVPNFAFLLFKTSKCKTCRSFPLIPQQTTDYDMLLFQNFFYL